MATFLDDLSEAARAELVRRSVRRTWPAGATLFQEGDRADRVIAIESGVVKAVATSVDGVEATLAIRGPGDVLGELGAVSGGARTASVVAVEPVAALVTPVEAFREFLRDDSSAAFALLTVLATRVTDASRRLVEFGSLDTSLRLARLLADLAGTYGQVVDDGTQVDLFSQDELASLCSASREAVARGLRTLRDAGLVVTGRRSVVVTDVDALRAWSPG